jgi:poly-gamma-glutamate synthesis protein (capsule biosynthesis protein)
MVLTIYAVGDIMLGEIPLCDNFGVKSIIKKEGPDFLFQNVVHMLKNGDIVFGNLECSIRNVASNPKETPYFFCADSDIVHGLKNAHFNVLSVANNHIMENGREMFLHTIRTLKDNDILPVGVRNEIGIYTIKGYRIAFLGYSFIEDYIVDVCYNKIESKDAIIKDIEKVKQASDLIIISLHWGYEYIPLPSPDQIQIARDLVDAGADIILGGHPHITQSYEIYKNRPIFYSLGNFIFDLTYIPSTRESFIAEITVHESPLSIDVAIIPIVINEADYQPRMIHSPQSDVFLNSVETIRNSFENTPVSDYCIAVGDYNLLYHKFKQPAKWNMKVQFMKNFYRYSYPTLIQIIKKFIGKNIGS